MKVADGAEAEAAAADSDLDEEQKKDVERQGQKDVRQDHVIQDNFQS